MRGFFAGMATCASVICIIQDAMGLDAYVRYVQTHWISAWIGTPLAVLILVSVWFDRHNWR